MRIATLLFFCAGCAPAIAEPPPVFAPPPPSDAPTEAPAPPPAEAPPESPGPGATGACAKAGCSGTICADAAKAPGIVSTCEFRPEYECYQSASCEPQADGACGWTPTSDLESCLKRHRAK